MSEHPDAARPRSGGSEVAALAVPAFLALVAEPLFLLTDSAIIGHLGTAPLAGLGVASAILLTAVNVFVFLAYATTATVARHLGARDRPGAISAGVDGLWLALGLGAVTAAVVYAAAEPICRAFGASAAALEQAVTYLQVSALGIPSMLVVLAATGVLRGLQDTRTPLYASVAGFAASIALNVTFVVGLGWGIAGSAWGTVIAQTGMALALAGALVRCAAREQIALRSHPIRVIAAARTGAPLLVRTLALRAVLVVTTWVAAGLGDVPLAAHQVTSTIWSLLAFALDAVAIAAQAITGKELGAGDVRRAREMTTLMTRYGVVFGVATGIVVLVLSPLLPYLFSPDPAVRGAITVALVVAAVAQPVAGYVFVIDGVLIGAGDGAWLAKAMVANLAAYLPLALGVHWLGVGLLADAGVNAAMVALWVAFGGFMLIRGLLLWHRVRGDGWMVTGVRR